MTTPPPQPPSQTQLQLPTAGGLSDDQAMVAALVKKIKEHYIAIEELRLEDRNKWREMNKRLEKLEHEKSKKGRKVRNKKKSDLKNESKAGGGGEKSNENKITDQKNGGEPSPKKDDREDAPDGEKE